jgi:hypothetical protein
MEGSMQAVSIIRSLLRRPKPIMRAEGSFSALDRATSNLIRARTEQIEKARRYWVCPFW